MSERQKAWVERFKYWACITKAPDAQTYDQAKEWAKDSGWFWRDVLTSAMAGKLMSIKGETKITTPTVHVTRATNLSLVANVEKAIPWENEIWDNNNFWKSSPNPTRIVFKAPGLYIFGVSAAFAAIATDNHCYVHFALNGQALEGYATNQMILTQPVYVDKMLVYYFHADDYLEVYAGCSSNQTINAAWLWAVAITPEAIIP